MSEISLSSQQQKIVDMKEGALLVKAGAGSGKTRVLTERIKALLPTTRRKILAITFTNKAGEEMRSRLEGVPHVDDQLFIGTFHGFCQQVLESHGRLIGLSTMPHIFEDEADRLKLIEGVLLSSPYYKPFYEEKPRSEQTDFLYRSLAFISQVKRNLQNEEDLRGESNDQDLVLLFKEYQDALMSQNAVDFDDLILLTYNLFATQPPVAALYRRTYEYICIDEAQDLNNAQYQLTRILTGDEHKNVMMVGDPNQSIFAFNGSSSAFMNEEFVQDYDPIIIDLKSNYRSAKKVLEAAEQVMPNSSDARDAVIEGHFEIVEAPDEYREAVWIYDKISELLGIRNFRDIEGPVTVDRIAVLARNKYVFNPLQKAFDENGMPYYFKITPGAIKYESDLMKMFDLALKVKINRQDSLHFNRLRGLMKASKCESLLELRECVPTLIYRDLIDWVLSLSDDGSNFKLSANRFSKLVETSTYLSDDNEKNMILKDIGELQTHWHNYAKKAERKSLGNFKNCMALGQTHPLAQGEGITLSTVHTMKGQEYEIVFLMGMDDETFPDYRSLRGPSIELTQERNNLYVAFTRAKRFLFVTWPRARTMPWGDVKYRNRSRFLRSF